MEQLAHEQVEIKNQIIFLYLFKLDNSFLILISDKKEMGIGTVTLGSPPIVEGTKSTSSSYRLFGIQSKLISSVITEKLSRELMSPVLLLLFLKNPKYEDKIAKALLETLDKLVKEIKKASHSS